MASSPALVATSAASLFPALALEPVVEGAPPLTAPALFGGARATVVTLAFQGSSQRQLEPWHRALWEALAPPPASAPPAAPAAVVPALPPVALLNVLYLQGWFWRLAGRVIKAATARSLPPGLAAATHVVLQPSARDADHACDALGVHNRMMGHVLLVDARGRVRWRAHGVPGEGEAAALVAACAAVSRGE